MNNKYSVLGSGWLGLALAKTMLQHGCPVNLSTTSETKLESLQGEGVDPFLIDINQLDLPSVATALDQFLQAQTLIINITSKNIEAFAQLAEKVAQSAVKQVLFISSTSVYSDCDCTVHEVDGRENPEHPLHQIERLFVNQRAFKTTILRFSGLVGYGRHPGRFFASGRAVPNPQGFVNLIHRDDCIHIILRILKHDVWGKEFNACADEHPERLSYYSYCAGLAGLPAPAAGAGYRYKIISNQFLKKSLNYEFSYPDPMAFDFD